MDSPARLDPHEDTLTCSVCLDLFRDPATLPCGHTYCGECLERSWLSQEVQVVAPGMEEELLVVEEFSYVCPECRRIFPSKPELNRNVVIADLVAQIKEVRVCDEMWSEGTGAGDVEVPCDACPESAPRPAARSCLRCDVSLCDSHLEPHRRIPRLRWGHRLAAPRLRETPGASGVDDGEGRRAARWCRQHGQELAVFCRDDGSLVCRVCATTAHRAHRVVPVDDERREKSKQLRAVAGSLRDEQRHLNIFLHEMQRARISLDEGGTALESRLERKFSEVLAVVTSDRSSAMTVAEEELRRKSGELSAGEEACRARLGLLQRAHATLLRLEGTRDNVEFIQGFMRDAERLITLSQSPMGPPVRPGLDFEEASVHEAHVDRMLASLSGPLRPGQEEQEERGTRGGATKERAEAPQLPHIRSALGSLFRRSNKGSAGRQACIKNYGCSPTLDPNTAHPDLRLSADLRTATWTPRHGTPLGVRDSCPNPGRFDDTWYPQALCRESFSSGRHYWEVDVSCCERWLVGAAYGSLAQNHQRTLGMGASSWSLHGEPGCPLTAWHAGTETVLDGANSTTAPAADTNRTANGRHKRAPSLLSAVGIYLEWEAGRLSFYGGAGGAGGWRLLHSFAAAFSRPLHPAVGVHWSGAVFQPGASGSSASLTVRELDDVRELDAPARSR